MAGPHLADGTLVDGRYRVLGLLGEGGMASVYEALDLRLSRRVALKALHALGDAPERAERLFREARGAACSDHPAIATIYGYGTDLELGISYVVMERLRGETLAQRLARTGALSIAAVFDIAAELLDALVAVHAAAVVHRDLKPSNVFLATRGRRVDEVKLLDFGVARLLDLHTLTAPGEVYGTPMYMAPEQLRDASDVDARADQYSLGLLLYECLTGRPPFGTSNLAVLTLEILKGLRLDLRSARPDCPEALVQFIARCTQVRPEARHPDTQAAADALRAAACRESEV